jgi:hypothetical protein
MPHRLVAKRDQHAAAMSYLDTGTLALADVLALLDDEPDEEGRPAARTIRGHRARWLTHRTEVVLLAALTAAVPLAYLIPSPLS